MAKETQKKEPLVEEKPEPKVKEKRVLKVLMSTNQYFRDFRNDVHNYTRAYVYPSYRGILKSREEWDKELEGKL